MCSYELYSHTYIPWNILITNIYVKWILKNSVLISKVVDINRYKPHEQKLFIKSVKNSWDQKSENHCFE